MTRFMGWTEPGGGVVTVARRSERRGVRGDRAVYGVRGGLGGFVSPWVIATSLIKQEELVFGILTADRSLVIKLQ